MVPVAPLLKVLSGILTACVVYPIILIYMYSYHIKNELTSVYQMYNECFEKLLRGDCWVSPSKTL